MRRVLASTACLALAVALPQMSYSGQNSIAANATRSAAPTVRPDLLSQHRSLSPIITVDYCWENEITGPRAGAVVRLTDGRVVAIECKLSNSIVNF